MDVKTHYKVELVQRGKRIKDLADALHMDYTKVSRILNGFVHEPPEFGHAVRIVLAKWDDVAVTQNQGTIV